MYKKVQRFHLESPRKVLVVDDELLSRNVVSKILYRYLGCEVYTAASGQEALSFLQSNDFDLLLVDMAMPGLCGADLVKRILDLKPHISLMVVTGNSTDEQLMMIRGLGIQHIVFKPFKIATLLEMGAEVLLSKEQINNCV